MGILLVATGLRVFQLDRNPPGFFCDESVNGYEAYCLLKTGRDLAGRRLPLFAAGFGNYNEAPFKYLVAASQLCLGLNEVAVRIVASIAGVLTVLGTFLLVREIASTRLALLSALLLSISPWHVHLSRVGFRAVLLPMCLTFALTFFLRSPARPRLLYAAAITFAACMYTYSSARVFVSLFLATIVVLYWRQVRAAGKHAVAGAALFLVLVGPAVLFWISDKGMIRAKATVIPVFDVAYYQYFSYFNPRYLFIDGDAAARHGIPGIGQLYHLELLTTAVGAFLLLRRRTRPHKLLLAWLLLYPLPACLTEPYHALRAVAGAPVFAIVSALGVEGILSAWRRRKRLRRLLVVGFVIGIAGSHGLFVVRHFRDYPRTAGWAWQKGMRKGVERGLRAEYAQVLVSDKIVGAAAHVLYFARFDPHAYLARPTKFGMFQRFRGRLGKFVIGNVKELIKQRRGATLCVLHPSENIDAFCAEVPGARPLDTANRRERRSIRLVEIR